MTALLVLLVVVVALVADALLMAWRRKKGRVPVPASRRPMREPRPPFGVFVDEGHAWLRFMPDGTLRLGVDDFITEAAGTLRGVALPRAGETLKRGEPLARLQLLGSRELVIRAPADGEVVAVNPDLAASPELVALDPYGLGWVLAMRTRDHKGAIELLQIGPGAAAFLRGELDRLLDLVALDAQRTPNLGRVMADGGVPIRGALAVCSEEAFQTFQKRA
jgi:glycine cleavage system H protein